MLPFLQPKKMAAILIAKHSKDGAKADHEEGDYTPEMHAAAEDLVRSLGAKDSVGVARAMQAAYDCLSSSPDGVGEQQE